MVVVVVMWQQDMPQLCKVLRLVLLQPEDFGSCEAWHQVVAPLLRQVLCLLGAFNVAPQLGVPDHLQAQPWMLGLESKCYLTPSVKVHPSVTYWVRLLLVLPLSWGTVQMV